MTIQEQYDKIRPLIKDGDIILFHGTSLLSRIIQTCDKSYFNHVGIIIEKFGSLYILDANSKGVQADRLSYRIDKCKPNGTLMILRSNKYRTVIDTAMMNLLSRADNKTIKYDFYNGVKELINRLLGVKFKVELDEGHDICSDFVSSYQVELGMVNEKFKELIVAFPQDSIRYMSEEVIIVNSLNNNDN